MIFSFSTDYSFIEIIYISNQGLLIQQVDKPIIIKFCFFLNCSSNTHGGGISLQNVNNITVLEVCSSLCFVKNNQNEGSFGYFRTSLTTSLISISYLSLFKCHHTNFNGESSITTSTGYLNINNINSSYNKNSDSSFFSLRDSTSGIVKYVTSKGVNPSRDSPVTIYNSKQIKIQYLNLIDPIVLQKYGLIFSLNSFNIELFDSVIISTAPFYFERKDSGSLYIYNCYLSNPTFKHFSVSLSNNTITNTEPYKFSLYHSYQCIEDIIYPSITFQETFLPTIEETPYLTLKNSILPTISLDNSFSVTISFIINSFLSFSNSIYIIKTNFSYYSSTLMSTQILNNNLSFLLISTIIYTENYIN